MTRSRSTTPDIPAAAQLCQECALCCNGTIFADVRFSAAEAATLSQFGLSPRPGRSNATHWKLPQPCPALCGTLCQVYENRPGHCRKFVCALLGKAGRGEITILQAQRIIRTARRHLKRLEHLLTSLEEPASAKSKPLKARLDAIARRLEHEGADAAAAAHFADLTQIRLQLQTHLARHFYPGE